MRSGGAPSQAKAQRSGWAVVLLSLGLTAVSIAEQCQARMGRVVRDAVQPVAQKLDAIESYLSGERYALPASSTDAP